MGNVLISTLHFYNNFGSVLQAYALRKTIQALGAGKTDILPYRPDLPEYVYFQDERLQRKYREKCGKFEDFRRKRLGMEQGADDRLRTEAGRIQDFMQGYGTFIAGSDIVWGREFSGLDPVYFLQAAPAGRNRAAYAASVVLSGDGRTEDDRLFEKWIPSFDAIAMRESSSVPCIQRFTSRKVTYALDPTLLLQQEDYGQLVIENADMKKEPYLLSYFLAHDPAAVDYTNMMAWKLGLRVIHYFADYPDRVFPDHAGCFAFAGPGEFLGYMKNAACIFTDSFHGTCFAMIYRKPFYTYMGRHRMLSRVRDITKRLGMESRHFKDFRDMPGVSLDTDYSGMEEKLAYERKGSLDFLNGVLGGRTDV